ncbi:MAG: AIR synthase-related protein, partial [Candidatus Korarchaeum sp.]|nr:AIR synthase-related protein [Candidatus Korarchaeum sp.]MDW8034996.1 AIR synthase-related protein [Candidatus Korarchaeum sp.]
VSAVVVGETQELLLPSDAKVGDLLVLIGVPGAEFLYLLATKKLDILERLDFRERIYKWRDYKWMLSCLGLTRTIPSLFKVRGMIWVGENGILESLDILSRLTGMGFIIWRDYIEFPPELIELSRYLSLDPLSVPSRGSVIVVLPKDSPTSQLREILDAHGYRVSFIGSLSRKGMRSVVEGDKIRELPSEFDSGGKNPLEFE